MDLHPMEKNYIHSFLQITVTFIYLLGLPSFFIPKTFSIIHVSSISASVSAGIYLFFQSHSCHLLHLYWLCDLLNVKSVQLIYTGFLFNTASCNNKLKMSTCTYISYSIVLHLRQKVVQRKPPTHTMKLTCQHHTTSRNGGSLVLATKLEK